MLRDLAAAEFPVSVGEAQQRLTHWIKFLRTSFEHVDENLRKAAVEALRSVLAAYVVPRNDASALFETEVMAPLSTALHNAQLHSAPSHKRIGLTRALGAVPSSLAVRFAGKVGQRCISN